MYVYLLWCILCMHSILKWCTSDAIAVITLLSACLLIADRATSYFLTKTFLELPLTLVQMFVQFIICYYMIDLQVRKSLSPRAIFGILSLSYSDYMDAESIQRLSEMLIPQIPSLSRGASSTSSWPLGVSGALPAQ
jgi:hypothetical protein